MILPRCSPGAKFDPPGGRGPYHWRLGKKPLLSQTLDIPYTGKFQIRAVHRFSAGGTEIEKLNALGLLQSTYAREVFERFPPGFSLLTPAVLFIRC